MAKKFVVSKSKTSKVNPPKVQQKIFQYIYTNKILPGRSIQVECYVGHKKPRTITGVVIFKNNHFITVKTRRRLETIMFADILNGFGKILKLQGIKGA